MPTENLREIAIRAIEDNKERLFRLSQSISDEPELLFQEHKTAAKLIAEVKDLKGIRIEKGVGGLETAFTARLGEGHPSIAILAEFDALPKIGHGCGHNLISTSTVGAMIGLAAAKEKLKGSVQIVGTPAEEGGGGKIILQERGVFNEIDVVYAIHPASTWEVGQRTLGMKQIRFKFIGKAAHAAYSPHVGRSALEAVIQTFVSINGMRQFTREDTRIHGIIEDGGTLPNIVPESGACLFFVRALEEEYVDELMKRIENCARAAALATDTNIEVFSGIGETYRPTKPNQALSRVLQNILGSLGVKEIENAPYLAASNDIGTLSHHVPVSRVMIKICESEIPIHSKEFNAASLAIRGRDGLILAAKLQALTAIELLENPNLVEEIKAEFKKK
jgi:amidohydrolase